MSYETDYSTLFCVHFYSIAPPSLSSEYGIAQTTLYKWIDKYSKKGGQEYSKADFIAIKKELARVQEERDLLKKVLTIFAEKKK